MGSSNLFLNIYTVMGCTQVTGMEDIFVFDGGTVAVDTNGSIGTTNQKAHVSLKSLHVQDKGTFQMKGVFPLSQHFEKIQVNLCWLSGNWVQVRYR